MFKDYYQILEVSRDASQPEIKKSYRKLAKAHHPDSNLNMDEGSQFLLINEAYQTLSDSISRESYNTRYDKISQIRKNTKSRKQASANVYSEAYTEPFTETYQEPYTPPQQEEKDFSGPYDFSGNYQRQAEQEYTYQPEDTFTSPKKSQDGLSKFYGLNWLVKTLAGLGLLFAISIAVDFFIAEASEVQTMIEARLTTGANEKVNCTIKTDKSEFPIAYQKYGYLGKGDELILYTTPIYKIMSSIQIIGGEKIMPQIGIYNSFSIFLVLLFICSAICLFLRNPAYILRLGIANIILAILTALILLRS